MTKVAPYTRNPLAHWHWLFITIALVLPLTDFVLPQSLSVTDLFRPIFIFAILALGLNVVTGYTGLLNLGVAAFMGIGAYTYAILTCDIYPFQLGFWLAVPATIAMGAIAGLLLGLPTIRLRGDYLAIVTLGFGEIVQDLLRNLESITKGTQGINPLPAPAFFDYQFATAETLPWYYLFLGILILALIIVQNLEYSRPGRSWVAVREDELAAAASGINVVQSKLLAFSIGAALCSLAGALWAVHLGSSGEPGNYDFQISIMALCILIVGGMGSTSGVLLGAVVMVGFNSIILTKLSQFLSDQGLISTGYVISSPNNWKYMFFGFALVLMMRIRPEGLLPSARVKAEIQHQKPTVTSA